MTIRRAIWKLVSIVVIAGFAVGCGGGSGRTAATVPVTGTVTLDGAPVAGAIVAFAPKAQGVSAAFGTTDASGQFTLTTVQPGDGAMVGSYDVTVTKTTAPAGAASGPSDYDPDSQDSVDAAYAEHYASEEEGADTEPKDLLPTKYKDAATSELKAEVTAGGDNNFTFALTEE